MSDLEFRAARKADEPAIRDLIFAVLDEYSLKAAPDGYDSDLFDIEGAYAGGAFDVVVDEAGVIVGTLGLKRLEDTRCELRKMYLAADYRGRGLGRRMLDHALARARALGFRRMELETAGVLVEAIALYEKAGFRLFEKSEFARECDRAMALDL